eukprot:11869877-Ditylum_brightwellii.AAC.1
MMCSVPKGRSIVVSGFCGETTSSEVQQERVWGLTLLDSERLVADLGDKTLPPMAYQELSILMDMVENYKNGSCEELEKCILNMVPTQRQLLLVFRTTVEAYADYDVDQLNKHYYEMSRTTQADGNY